MDGGAQGVGVRFARERVRDLWAEAAPLLAAHYAEIAHYPDIPLDPDRLFYEMAEATGLLRCYTARSAGELVGYADFIVRASPKYRSSRQANQDVIYLSPGYRGGHGLRFIRWCRAELAAEGVQVLYQQVKAAHNRFGKVLEHEGYELVDLVYAIRLDTKGRP